MEKLITRCSEKCHPEYIPSVSVLCWTELWSVEAGFCRSNLSRSSRLLQHSLLFLLQRVPIQCFNQEEINSPRDKYWSLKSRDCNRVIWVVTCTFRATPIGCLEVQQRGKALWKVFMLSGCKCVVYCEQFHWFVSFSFLFFFFFDNNLHRNPQRYFQTKSEFTCTKSSREWNVCFLAGEKNQSCVVSAEITSEVWPIKSTCF